MFFVCCHRYQPFLLLITSQFVRFRLLLRCWSVFDSLIFLSFKIIHAFLCKICTHQLPMTWFTNVQLSSQFQQLLNWLDGFFICLKWRYKLMPGFFFSGNGMFSLIVLSLSLSGFCLYAFCFFFFLIYCQQFLHLWISIKWPIAKKKKLFHYSEWDDCFSYALKHDVSRWRSVFIIVSQYWHSCEMFNSCNVQTTISSLVIRWALWSSAGGSNSSTLKQNSRIKGFCAKTKIARFFGIFTIYPVANRTVFDIARKIAQFH